MSDDLEPIGPAEALVMWLNYIVSDRSDSTVQTYEYRLEPFVQWCEDDGIEDLEATIEECKYQFVCCKADLVTGGES